MYFDLFFSMLKLFSFYCIAAEYQSLVECFQKAQHLIKHSRSEVILDRVS